MPTFDLETWLGLIFVFFLACLVIFCIIIAIIITRK